MLVSIIIPTKNRCDLLRETLASVVAQTHSDWEAIVIDDGSTDDTEKMISELISRDQRVRFLRREKKPSGASACRNVGLAVAGGEYVVFLDSDDLLAPECLKKRLKIMDENAGLDFVTFLARIFSTVPGDGPFLWNNFTEEDDLDRFLRRDPPWQTSGPLWRRASLAKIGPWDERALSAQDWEFHIRALIAGLKYLKVSKVDTFWRRTETASLTHAWGTPRRTVNRVRLYQKITGMLRVQKMLTERRRRILAAEYYDHAFVINRNRRLACKIWIIARRDKLVGEFGFAAIWINDFLFRCVRRVHKFFMKRLLPETCFNGRTLWLSPPTAMNRILILGAGPTGLGAARRLEELGHHDWLLLEGSSKAGGLASSFVDEKGFTWDIGGHVQFSHYAYFDRAMEELLGKDGWLHHERESWVWMRDRFIPYPFQNNIRHLPADDLERCLAGLRQIANHSGVRPANFREWILATFGQGIADVFMLPYNFKVWAFPPEVMSAGWVGERVAVTDIKRVLQNIEQARDDVSWGPNNTFQFPLRGGTGAIWEECARRLPLEQLRFNTRAIEIDVERRCVKTSDGQTLEYDTLISTLPLRELIRLSGQSQLNEPAERGLLYSSSNIFGIGLRGAPPESLRTKCWMYFPESDCPFYRVTAFSNYSPNNVPDIATTWSLMAEVSESAHKPVNQERLLDEVIQGLFKTRLIERKEDIISTWKYRAGYGYPTPGLERDTALSHILPFFESKDIYSRGRFGLWKYEVSNQDHSFMQGVEVVERLLNGRAEVTAQNPNLANSKKHPWPFEAWE